MWVASLALFAAPGDSEAARVYMVRKGDTLSGISRRYDVGAREIARFNGIALNGTLSIGQKLRIPPHARQLSTYTVQPGDSLELVADRYDISASALIKHNDIKNPDRILIGQTLTIPGKVETRRTAPESPPRTAGRTRPTPSPATRRETPPATARSTPASAVQDFSSLWRYLNRTSVKRGRWRYIVVHHSASRSGTTEGIDRYHREGRRMENGLAYHFVIGNGRGMTHGQIDIGHRWLRQLDGGHLASDELNRRSIGICLIGNFDKAPPSAKQLDSLTQLTRYLMKRTGLPQSAVRTHRGINTKPTVCPGRYFPERQWIAKL